MNGYRYAARAFPGIVPDALQSRVRQVYADYEEDRHQTIPPDVRTYLQQQKRFDVLAELTRTGLQFGFGWSLYRVEGP